MQTSAVQGAVNATNYGLGRLSGAIQLTRQQLEDSALGIIPTGLTLPVDTNLYTEIAALCPGILPPLPKNAALALAAVSALQALITSKSPAETLNTLVGNPLGRLKAVESTLENLATQVQSTVEKVSSVKAKIPGSTGEAASAVGGLIAKEALAFANRAVNEALAKAGIDPAAADRCAGRLCAVGSRWNPPG